METFNNIKENINDLRIVDFSKAAKKIDVDESEEDWIVGEEIVECFENIGFVYIKNHGISQQLIERVFEVSKSFFKSSKEQKSQLSNKNDYFKNNYLGFNDELLESSQNLQELRESFNIVDRSSDYLPKEIEGFDENTSKLIEEGSTFYKKLLRCLEVGLKLPFGTLINIHTNLCSDSNNSTLRLLHYPPIPFEIPENSIRCGAHTDFGFLTILFQDKMGGLEVKNRNNEWVNADPIPGTLLVNVGDMFQKMTSGRVVATEHRVLIPEEERKRECCRMSVVFFLITNFKTVLKPFAKSDDDDEHYLTSYDYLYQRFNDTLSY